MRHVDSQRQQFAEPRRLVGIETAQDLALTDLEHCVGLGPVGSTTSTGAVSLASAGFCAFKFSL